MSSRVIEDKDVLDGLSVWFLKMCGLWRVINDYRVTGNKNYIAKLLLASTLLLNSPYIMCQYLVYFFIKVDLQKVTFLNLHAVPCVQMVVRILVFWFRLGSICEFYGLIKKDFLTCIPERERENIKEIYRKISWKANMLYMSSILTNTSIAILWIAVPGISVEYITHQTGPMVNEGPQKILGGWYPLPIAESPYFVMIFCFEVLLQIWDSLMLSVYAGLFYLPLVSLHAQFSALGYHISTLTTDMTKASRGDEDSAIYRELYKIIQEHLKLIKCTEELRRVYNPLVTLIIGMGILTLIIAIFQFLFGRSSDPIYIIKFFQYLAYQAIEVCMFCFGSSAVETASSNLQFAIYSSDWYRADLKYRRAGQMVMVRASRGLTLTAIRMYPINVETMMNTFQLTYTVAALMSRMVE